MLILGLKRLKGLHVCYAICYLFKSLKALHPLNSIKKGSVLSFVTIFRH